MKAATQRLVPYLLTLAAALLLGACGGGAATESRPNLDGTAQSVSYTGPPPATGDVQRFKLNLWDNLSAANRCGDCHTQDGPGRPPPLRAL